VLLTKWCHQLSSIQTLSYKLSENREWYHLLIEYLGLCILFYFPRNQFQSILCSCQFSILHQRFCTGIVFLSRNFNLLCAVNYYGLLFCYYIHYCMILRVWVRNRKATGKQGSHDYYIRFWSRGNPLVAGRIKCQVSFRLGWGSPVSQWGKGRWMRNKLRQKENGLIALFQNCHYGSAIRVPENHTFPFSKVIPCAKYSYHAQSNQSIGTVFEEKGNDCVTMLVRRVNDIFSLEPPMELVLLLRLKW